MNYLSHLFLSQPTIESRVGNLLGDFRKGVDIQALPSKVVLGYDNHRLVDRFTDSHPKVLDLKALISPQRRRFAGIMLDMVFDHFLIVHWERFDELSFESRRSIYYRDLAAGNHLMPDRMQRVTTNLIENDWFSAYSELDGVGYALDRISERIRFKNDFSGSIDELKIHKNQIEDVYLDFFPQLLEEVKNQSIEQI
ncbi:ACP phosphodiesterase [Cocleimonas sp. KMM 6892]|uniref:acyl carrier protein phosphodiesterase n=1 Tax=unclassified Cocleimonas TaxID=2639732 RepID=UPI002DBE04D7|nr:MULTISPECIES: ACP phosphodiesterase [unclassified Cocleimonas]MEB8431997.1 ACP phosphodiesterase [Cocleimonas sp. KMM 6892]MEC4714917.1 ACP phosphodiesterase [Cocleimonas sp. KMM 6895]MEC4744269.1 ACP phosphodiesterase [Cocleimonas sp. KMM 6896]